MQNFLTKYTDQKKDTNEVYVSFPFPNVFDWRNRLCASLSRLAKFSGNTVNPRISSRVLILIFESQKGHLFEGALI